MIDGLRIKIESAELKTLLMTRVEYHQGRAKTKEAELPGLRESMERIKAVQPTNIAQVNKMSSNVYHVEDAVENLERDIKNHKNKALVFEFYANHLFDETYSLTESDLQRLELVKSI